ncbi:thiamine pyrophosphate-requiring protein [Microbacterium sp. SYP-A9085]|uniref:thiamine pyrophosphate-requiring protein n=1 Tax=Microbacterium sp. SYP-A9085 TaxID=2664454 RepID=UPI00129B5FB3|nr:thiamine pyrophosphate-requiring protein [Microbacterium sp. SYP-A9085]MRH28281.1 thiamine pyrophosphate-requiring protein [Microbacterium sp. SYP-A9085]
MTLSGGSLLIRSLREAGVTHLFANFGSDHPAIIEALADDRERGIADPAVVLCPHEYTALSAAHGYAAVTGRPQAVFVHTDVGTANLGGAVHNAARSRVPVFIFAGLTPYTLEGELPGTRNTHVNHLQDAPDQHALVRQYVKWNYDIRTARNVPQVVRRAVQLAASAPAGPVYVTGAREVLAEQAPDPQARTTGWAPIAPLPAPADVVDALVRDLREAQHPVIITGYLGRRHGAVQRLVTLAERLVIPVVEVTPEVLNFPHDHRLHQGDDPLPLLEEADVIVALDTDAPWMPTAGRPREDATIYVINDDPLQERIPLWYLPADHVIRADAGVVLAQALDLLGDAAPDPRRAERADRLRERSQRLRRGWAADAEAELARRELTPGSVAHVLAGLIDDDTVVLNEAISEAPAVWRHLPRSLPGTLYGNRGTSLGWSGGGALGVKLAVGDRTVVSVVGDGTYFFGIPSSAFWVADRYHLPVLTVILDNGGWNATKRNLRRQHPDMTADRTDRYWVNLQQSADLPGIAAAAGNAWGVTVTVAGELEGALREGLAHVRAGRPAVVCVRLEPISRQVEDPI